MTRTQEEILNRFNTVEDLFGTQKGDLIEYLTFENAKPFLKEEYIKDVESVKENWEQSTDPKKDILDYLDFAYEKAENQRGLSAARSMFHFKAWIWLDDPDFYQEIESEIDNYDDYGIPVLDKISEKYNYVKQH